MNSVDKNNLDDLDLLKNEIKQDLQRELVINALADHTVEEQEVVNQKIIILIKQRYKEALKNLYEDISETKIEDLVKTFEFEINKNYSDFMKN